MRRRRAENTKREFNQSYNLKDQFNGFQREDSQGPSFEVLSNTYSNAKLSTVGPIGSSFKEVQLGKREARIVEVHSDGDPVIETQAQTNQQQSKRPRRDD